MDSKTPLNLQQSSGDLNTNDTEKGAGKTTSFASVLSGKERQSELISSSEPELSIHPEIAEIGVEKTEKRPVLTPEHEEAGLKFSEPEPVITAKSQEPSLELPLAIDQAKHIAKTGKPDDKRFWLANLILKVVAKLRRQNKNE